MKFRIGKDGSGSNIHAATPSNEGRLLLDVLLEEASGEDILRSVLARGITIYRCRDYNPWAGGEQIIASKDNKRWTDLGRYIVELGISPEEAEQLRQDVVAALGPVIEGSLFSDFAFAFCAARLSQIYVLHRRQHPYRLKLNSGKMVAHVNKQWKLAIIRSPWTEDAKVEIHGENPKLYGENDASVSLVPAYDRSSYYGYDLFERDTSIYDGDLSIGSEIPVPSDLAERAEFFANLFKRATPPPFGTYRMDAWPQDIDKCRVPALNYDDGGGENAPTCQVAALVPSGQVSFEQRNIDPNSLAGFFNSAPHQFENYQVQTITESDWSLAQTPTPVSKGGIGPVRPGLYYKEGRLVAIITGEYYGHVKGKILIDGGGDAQYETYEKVSDSNGVVTLAISASSVPEGSQFPDEIDGQSSGQRQTASRLVRHFLHEVTEPGVSTDNSAIEVRIALTIRTGSAERLVDTYRSTSVDIDGIAREPADYFEWRANIGTDEEPNEVILTQSTDENGRKVVTVPLDQGVLETDTNTDGARYYLPLQEVTILLTARFTSSSVIGSFRTAPDDQLDFDTYQPYEIRDLGIRTGAANMLPRVGA